MKTHWVKRHYGTALLVALGLASTTAHSDTDISIPSDLGNDFRGSTQTTVPKAPREAAEPFFLIDTNFRRNTDVLDFRNPTPMTNAKTGLPTGQGTFALTQSNFDLSVLAYHENGNSVRFGVDLPMNMVSASNPSAPTGVEFGGIGTSLSGHIGDAYGFLVSFDDNVSSTLKLYDKNYELGTGFYFLSQQDLGGNTFVHLKAGPEVAYEFAPSDPGVTKRYGLQWGARARADTQTGRGTSLHLHWSVEGLFRRMSSYSVNNVDQGGGGLLTFMPGVEYDVMKSLWIGLRAELPLFRPQGDQVAAFNSMSLPGLLGSSVGLTVRVSAM